MTVQRYDTDDESISAVAYCDVTLPRYELLTPVEVDAHILAIEAGLRELGKNGDKIETLDVHVHNPTILLNLHYLITKMLVMRIDRAHKERQRYIEQRKNLTEKEAREEADLNVHELNLVFCVYGYYNAAYETEKVFNIYDKFANIRFTMFSIDNGEPDDGNNEALLDIDMNNQSQPFGMNRAFIYDDNILCSIRNRFDDTKWDMEFNVELNISNPWFIKYEMERFHALTKKDDRQHAKLVIESIPMDSRAVNYQGLFRELVRAYLLHFKWRIVRLRGIEDDLSLEWKYCAGINGLEINRVFNKWYIPFTNEKAAIEILGAVNEDNPEQVKLCHLHLRYDYSQNPYMHSRTKLELFDILKSESLTKIGNNKNIRCFSMDLEPPRGYYSKSFHVDLLRSLQDTLLTLKGQQRYNQVSSNKAHGPMKRHFRLNIRGYTTLDEQWIDHWFVHNEYSILEQTKGAYGRLKVYIDSDNIVPDDAFNVFKCLA